MPPPLLFLVVHLYTLGLHLLGGELNLCRSAALLRLPAVVPTSAAQHSLSLKDEEEASDQDPGSPRGGGGGGGGRSFDTGARGRAE